jgi:hypothetical protein
LNISRFVVEQRSRARCALITYRFMNGVYPGRMEARSEGQNAEIKLIFSG